MERIGHESEHGAAAGEMAPVVLPPDHEFANSPALDMGVTPLSPLMASGERDNMALDHMADTLKRLSSPERANPMGTEALKVMLSSIEDTDLGDGHINTAAEKSLHLLGILRGRITETPSDELKDEVRNTALRSIDEAITFYTARADDGGAAAGDYVPGEHAGGAAGGAGGAPAYAHGAVAWDAGRDDASERTRGTLGMDSVDSEYRGRDDASTRTRGTLGMDSIDSEDGGF